MNAMTNCKILESHLYFPFQFCLFYEMRAQTDFLFCSGPEKEKEEKVPKKTSSI